MGEWGEPLLPWQSYVLDVMCEVAPSRRWLHPIGCLCVSRQNGKTRIAKARIAAELFLVGGFRVLHTAQDRAVPREIFLEIVDLIDRNPKLKRRMRGKPRMANGQEALKLRSGAEYRILAPRQDRFRSWPASLIVFDEAREHRAMDLGEAARFTLRTAPRPQTLYLSNAGDPASIRLNTLRSRGLAAVEDPLSDPDMCYLEWSAPTDDPYDLEGWRQANPSLGSLLPPQALLEELRDAEGSGDFTGFLTEGLCRWVDVTSAVAIPPAAWEQCGAVRQPKKFTPKDRIVLAVELYPDRSSAALVAAAVRNERVIVSVVESWEGADNIDEADVGAAVLKYARHFRPEAIGFDPATTAGVANHVAVKYPKRMRSISGTNWVTACGQLWDAVTAGRLVHLNDPDLTKQVGAAARKNVGDGTWRISRIESGEPIPAVMALARAVHLAYRPRVVPQVM